MVADHIINYETWGKNEAYFVSYYHGYSVTCDINYFSEPTNCIVIDENEKKVSNDILLSLIDENECYWIENDNLLPCRMD